jgi:short-subunit dehydrogenase
MITGATGGLGKAFAVECASRGWNLFLTDLRPASLQTLSDSLCRTYGVRVQYLACDLADPLSRSELFEYLHQAGLRFWGLINVAGLDYEGLFRERKREQIRSILRVNIEGTLEVTHALLERRDPRYIFRIINVGSLAGFYPMPVKATYAASKRFLLDFSIAMREELRPQGVTVTILCPAGMPTTASCIQGIEAQGLMGQLTTQDIGSVASRTLDQALRGQAVYIPGLLNRLLWLLGSLTPPVVVAKLIGKRWRQTSESSREILQPPCMLLQDDNLEGVS